MNTLPSRRLESMDALRGVAIIFMVIDHSFDWWLAGPYRGGTADVLTELIGTFAAPIFFVLLGVGQVLSMRRRSQQGANGRQATAYLVRRGLFIVAMGYLLNALTFFVGDNLYDVFAVDVLHVLGLGLLLAIPLARSAHPAFAFALAVIWAVGSALWGGNVMLPPALGAWVNGETGIGYFPALPWLAYVWFGVGLGDLLWRRMQQRKGNPAPLSGILALAAGGWLIIMMVVPNIGFRHPRLGHICLSLVVFFGLWALLTRLENLSGVTRRVIVSPLALMGQVSLMLYGVHHLLGYRLLYHLGVVRGRAWRGHFGTLTPNQAFIGLLAMLVLCYAISAPWKRIRRRVESETLGRLPGFRDLRTQQRATQ